MPRVLVAEDSPTQAAEIQFLLEDAGFEVEIARDGVAALEAMVRCHPDIVLTDLEMPRMNGLELVEAIRSRFPAVPVTLMTAMGSEEIASQALLKGAASYVPKRNLARDIVPTLQKLLTLVGAGRQHERLLDCWDRSESSFVLINDPSLIPPLVGHLSENLIRMRFCDETSLIRINVALSEALSNAIYHGNLEVSSDLREDDDTAYFALAQARCTQAPYLGRRVHVIETGTPSEVTYVIRDQGPGFDPSTLPDPRDPASLEKASGRGLLLIRSFMDRVEHSESGTVLTMVKKRER
jgi:CheY-like chemotaxis protein/anti-sigma regulatory factor (Ser/Thr protein kinase)